MVVRGMGIGGGDGCLKSLCKEFCFLFCLGEVGVEWLIWDIEKFGFCEFEGVELGGLVEDNEVWIGECKFVLYLCKGVNRFFKEDGIELFCFWLDWEGWGLFVLFGGLFGWLWKRFVRFGGIFFFGLLIEKWFLIKFVFVWCFNFL